MNMANIGDDDKKKLIALGGLVGVVLLVLIYLFFFRGGSSSTPVAQVTPPATPTGLPGGGNGAAPAGAPAGGGNVTAVSLASLSGPRSDPFTPQYILPPPPPPPPEPLPKPEILPTPQPYYAMGLPPAVVAGNKPSTVMIALPPISLPGITHHPKVPRDFRAPKQSGGGGAVASPSSSERLSGVIIGDSVHALLEVTDASGTQTYVVQPGDTIAGINVLGLQRVEVGGKIVPRLLIRENGKERYVDLRPAPQQQTGQQAGGGANGLPGNPGAFPAKPTIFPAQSMRPGQQIGRGANPFSAN